MEAMHKLTYGLFILTARDGAKDNGCVVNTVMQVTTEPNRIIAVINKQNLTHDMVMKTGLFNVTVLSRRSGFEVYRHWGMQSGRETDKLHEVTISRSANGLVYLPEGNACLSAKVVSMTDLGTHTLFLADVTEERVLSDEESVTYSFYHGHIKPAPVKQVKGFVCTVCGYIYEGSTLPADFVCPLCKHPASDFVPIDQ